MTFIFDFSLLVGTISTKSVGFDVPNLVVDSQGFYDLCCPDPCEGVPSDMGLCHHILSLVLSNTLAGPNSVQKWYKNDVAIKKKVPGISKYPIQNWLNLRNHLNWCTWCMADGKEFLGCMIGTHDSTEEVMPSVVWPQGWTVCFGCLS